MSGIRVFKFGGASLRDVDSIRNMCEILRKETGRIAVVVSAMGKTTNALEAVAHAYWEGNGHAGSLLQAILEDHKAVAQELLGEADAEDLISTCAQPVLDFMEQNQSREFTFIYDQIVCLGELMSSSIITEFLRRCDLDAGFLDIRKLIKTDQAFTEAKVDWVPTQINLSQIILGSSCQFVVGQGFIGSTKGDFTTTLGREGSDYTAAVIAYCCDAESLTIWKDVPGVLNADPNEFPDAVLMERISFHEAIEMSFYGAKVIHPKTIKPLQNKNIPLYVRSFLNPDGPGTEISGKFDSTISLPPVKVFRRDQVLVSFSVRDFSFVGAENLSHIYKCLADQRLNLNMIHNGAISFSVSLDNKPAKIQTMIKSLEKDFEIRLNEGLELLTVRHYTPEVVEELTEGKEILLEEKTRSTIQVLMRHL